MTTSSTRPEPSEVAELLKVERYPDARVLFCGGSAVRGDGTQHSDLDVVVVHDSVARAWREAFIFRGWPIEVFAHDLETLAYFVEKDVSGGRPTLAQMISEGICVPDAPFGNDVRSWARSVLEKPPSPSTQETNRDERYRLSDLLDDLRDPRPRSEELAIACELYPRLCNFVLAARGSWLADGKLLPRALYRVEPELAGEIHDAFERLLREGDRTSLVRMVEKVLGEHGGLIFDGYHSFAPVSWRTRPRLPKAQVP